MIAGLYVACTVTSLVSNFLNQSYGNNLRHEAGGDDLEHPCNTNENTGQVASNARAQSQETYKQRHHSEEQGDEHEGEHESRHQEVVIRAGVINQ